MALVNGNWLEVGATARGVTLLEIRGDKAIVDSGGVRRDVSVWEYQANDDASGRSTTSSTRNRSARAPAAVTFSLRGSSSGGSGRFGEGLRGIVLEQLHSPNIDSNMREQLSGISRMLEGNTNRNRGNRGGRMGMGGRGGRGGGDRGRNRGGGGGRGRNRGGNGRDNNF